MDLNHFAAVTQAVTEMLNRHSDLFVLMGRRLFQGFAVILISWFGIRAALASAEGRGFPYSRFAGLLLTIAFGFAMTSFYHRPIPGFGLSFPELITEQALFLADRIQSASVEDIQLRLHEVYASLEAPYIFDGIQIARYFLTVLAIALAETAVLAVISYGFVALGVIVLVGPIFVPFFIVPQLEWLFWGWFRAFIQYAFYQVVAYAFTAVFSSLLVSFFDAHPPPFDGARITFLFFPFLFLLLAFTYGVLKVPSLTSQIFTGRSGDSALPRFLS